MSVPRKQGAGRGALELVGTESAVARPTVDELLADGQAAEQRGHRTEARECYERALHGLGRQDGASRASTILR